jgi:hypothetical protein
MNDRLTDERRDAITATRSSIQPRSLSSRRDLDCEKEASSGECLAGPMTPR